MSWLVIRFASVDEANEYIADNTCNPISICAGHVANQLVVLFNVPGSVQMEEQAMPVFEMQALAREKSHKEVPDEPVDDEEEEEQKPEEEERPEAPTKLVARKKRNPPRLPVHRGAKSKTVAKRKAK